MFFFKDTAPQVRHSQRSVFHVFFVVFILGGAGFLGYHTSLQLSSLNIDVVVLDDIENETEGASQLDEFAYWRRMRADKLLMKGKQKLIF